MGNKALMTAIRAASIDPAATTLVRDDARQIYTVTRAFPTCVTTATFENGARGIVATIRTVSQKSGPTGPFQS